MKIDRRNFLSFAIGGAVGTALSPLPWKLTDDSSIWSQMWPWTPVPEDGEYTYVKSVSTLCSGGCGVSVRKVNDRAVKIEGMTGYPGNDGGVCNLCGSGLQLQYGPTRIPMPLKRHGDRGSGKWVPISWEAAIDELAAKLGELRSSGKSHTVGCISGTDRGTVANLLDRFLRVYGSPNFIRTPSIEDAYELTLQVMHGTQGSVGFDLENAGYVLSFGAGILDGWGTSARMFRAHAAWRDNQVKLVQIDPRLSVTAAKSGHWIPIEPGTEGALALAMAHVIIRDQLYNDTFVMQYSSGFEAWQQVVMADFAPAKAAEVTGVPADKIEALAKEFAGADRPVALCGRGKGNVPGTLAEFMAVHALNALVGNINQEGGVWTLPQPDYIEWPEAEGDDIASAGLEKARIDGAGTDQYPMARNLLNRLPAGMAAAGEDALQVLFVYDANPLYTMPDTAAMRQALAKIPLVVSFASNLDETAAFADLILPNHSHLERYEDVPTPIAYHRPMVGLARPVLSPQLDTRHVGDVVIQLAAAMGGTIADAFAWDSYEACLEETLGDKWDALLEEGFWVDEAYTPPQWYEAFNTDSGRFEFSTDTTPAYAPIAIEGAEGSFPLVLVPVDSMRLAAGAIGSTPFLVKTVEDTVLKGKDIFVEVNPETAAKLGLREGSRTMLTTPKGQAKVRVHLYAGLKPGLVAMPRGLGHTGVGKYKDVYLVGKGINVNDLIGTVEDPASGHNAAWGIRAKLA